MMTQEEKQLVLIDLCARWLYGVIVSPLDCGKAKVVGFKGEHPLLFDLTLQKEYERPWEIEYVKPYLRPLSSMTEEEREELRQEQIKDEQLFTDCIKNHPERRGLIIPHFASEWCDKNMFDHRGLILNGLALIAPEGMYNNDLLKKNKK